MDSGRIYRLLDNLIKSLIANSLQSDNNVRSVIIRPEELYMERVTSKRVDNFVTVDLTKVALTLDQISELKNV